MLRELYVLVQREIQGSVEDRILVAVRLLFSRL